MPVSINCITSHSVKQVRAYFQIWNLFRPFTWSNWVRLPAKMSYWTTSGAQRLRLKQDSKRSKWSYLSNSNDEFDVKRAKHTSSKPKKSWRRRVGGKQVNLIRRDKLDFIKKIESQNCMHTFRKTTTLAWYIRYYSQVLPEIGRSSYPFMHTSLKLLLLLLLLRIISR